MKVESILSLYFIFHVGLANVCDDRSMQQVTDRLDRLISAIKDVQRPHMEGGKQANVVLVCQSIWYSDPT